MNQTNPILVDIVLLRKSEVVKAIKNMKIKVQASIQEDQVRVSGKDKDDLQAVIQMLKQLDIPVELQFVNFRS